MKETNWDKIGELIDKCIEHQEKDNVDIDLWGLCEKCPVADTCPCHEDGQ